jgi:hypothetical protein
VVSAGEKVVNVRVKRTVAVMTGLVGKLGREDGQAVSCWNVRGLCMMRYIRSR